MVIKKILKAVAKKSLKSKSKVRKMRSHPKPKVKSKATIERDRNQKKFVAMHKKVQAKRKTKSVTIPRKRKYVAPPPRKDGLQDKELFPRNKIGWDGISPTWRKGYVEKGKRSVKRKPRFNIMEKKNQPTGSVTRNMSVDGTPIYERYEPTGLGSFGATFRNFPDRYKSGKKFGKIKPKSSMTKKYFPFSQTGKPTRVGGMTQSELDRVYPNSRWATKRGLHERAGSNTLNFFADTSKTRTDKALWGTVGFGTASLPPLFGAHADIKSKNEFKKKTIPNAKAQRDLKAEQEAAGNP